MFCTYEVFCYVMGVGGGGGGTVVSIYKFVFYVLHFDDFYAIKSSCINIYILITHIANVIRFISFSSFCFVTWHQSLTFHFVKC